MLLKDRVLHEVRMARAALDGERNDGRVCLPDRRTVFSANTGCCRAGDVNRRPHSFKLTHNPGDPQPGVCAFARARYN